MHPDFLFFGISFGAAGYSKFGVPKAETPKKFKTPNFGETKTKI